MVVGVGWRWWCVGCWSWVEVTTRVVQVREGGVGCHTKKDDFVL